MFLSLQGANAHQYEKLTWEINVLLYQIIF